MRLCEGQQIMSSPLRHDPEGCEGRRTNSWNAAVSVAVWLTDMSSVPSGLISVVRPCWMMSVWWGKYSQSLMPPSVSDARSVPWRRAPSQGITWRYSHGRQCSAPPFSLQTLWLTAWRQSEQGFADHVPTTPCWKGSQSGTPQLLSG